MQRRDTNNYWFATAALLLLPAIWSCTSDDTEREEIAETEEEGEEEEGEGVATQSVCPPGSTLDYATFGSEFMSDYCISCHSSQLSGVARAGAPEGYDFDTLEGILAEAEEIDEWAAAGPAGVNTAMPPVAPMPTEEERRQLGEWLACEASN